MRAFELAVLRQQKYDRVRKEKQMVPYHTTTYYHSSSLGVLDCEMVAPKASLTVNESGQELADKKI